MTSSDVCHLSIPPLIKKWNDSFDIEQPDFTNDNLNLVSGLISKAEVDARRALRTQRRAQMQAVSDAFMHDSIERTFDDIESLSANREKTADTRKDTMDELGSMIADNPMAEEADYDDIQGLEADRSEADKQATQDRRQQMRSDALAALSDVGLSGFSEEVDAQKAALMISASLTEAGDAHFKHTFTLGMQGKPAISLAGRDAASYLMMQGVGVAEMTDDEKVGALQMQRMH